MTTGENWRRLVAVVRRIEKLKGRSMEELRERAAQALSAELEFRGLAATVGEPTDEALWAAMDHDRVAGQGAIADRIHRHFTRREAPAFFAGVRDGASAVMIRAPRWASECAKLIAAADDVVAGRFNLLGHGDLSFGAPVDWHLDPVSNRRAPRIHWSRIPYLNAELIGDHKVIWEINRHQHFFILGRAYRATGRAEYAECFAEHLSSWMDANPPKDGVNWASSLEVAYRAIAWLWALELFRDAEQLTPALLQRTLKYLSVHGRHLERYLSSYFSPNTHLTGEALGLLYLGVLLPELRRSDTWRDLGWRILQAELPRQVYPDGVYFEQATYYHRYTVDIYLHAVILAERNQIDVPVAMRERLSAAVSHLADLMRPDGTMPIIGDDDGGSLVVLEAREFVDVRSALATAAVVLQRPELAVVAGRASEEVLWLLGRDGVRDVESQLGGEPPLHQSRVFREGGYGIMRDGWGAEARHAIIDAGPLGAMNCGHAHSDSLAVEISAGGCAFLVDPGTYTYTASAADRDHFRDSAAHNTLTVDGQSASVPSGPFSWAYRTDARIEQWWSGTLTDRLTGSHDGFSRLSDPVVHRRSLVFVRGEYWVLLDTVVAEGAHEATAHFHAAMGAVVEPASECSAWIDARCTGRRARLFFAVAGDVDTLEWGEDWVSPSYGRRELAPCGRVSTRGTGRRDLITVLVPTADGIAPMIREMPANQGRAVVVDRPDRYDLFLFEQNGGARVDDVQMNADMALVRRGSVDGEVAAMALFGVDARLTVGKLTFEARTAAEATRHGTGWTVVGEGRIIVRD